LAPFANFLAFLVGGALALHPGPSVWGDFLIAEDRVRLTINGAAGPLQTNLSIPHLMIGPLTDAQRSTCAEHLERRFSEGFPVEIDGKRVLPEVVELEIQDGVPDDKSWKMAGVTLDYPCDAMPRRISIRWDEFAGEGIDFVPMTIKRVGEAPGMFSLWPDHPTWTWHAEEVRLERPPTAAEVPMAVERWRIPALSVAVLLLGLVLLTGLRRGRRAGPAFGALCIVAAVLGRSIGVVEVAPLWSSRVALPAPPQARAIFEALHANLYAAFAEQSEDAIYDQLAIAVAPELLDSMYGDVYESLILRQEGGAVCSIASVDRIEGGIDESAYEVGAAPVFDVDWSWSVKGIVSHHGHVHERVNRYRATYTVRHDGAAWKIAAVEVHEHERVDGAD